MLNIFTCKALKKNKDPLNIMESKGESATKARHYPPATKE